MTLLRILWRRLQSVNGSLDRTLQFAENSTREREENVQLFGAESLAHFIRGLLMGSADAVPGVSGGTVALIVGIYERLVAAISNFDLELVRLIAARRWRAAFRRIDLPLLLPLGAGIFVAIVSLASLMNFLLLHRRSVTLAAFFGLILASTVLVARRINPRSDPQRTKYLIAGIAAAAFAFWLTGLQAVAATDHLAYYFFCGMIAICAMILPGISGAFLLLILGVYEPITTIIKDLTHGNAPPAELAKLFVFAAGCGIGLIAFAKIVRMLLARAHDLTMAVLCGFMLGSLRRIWPFQRDLTPEIEKLSHKEYENFVPSAWTGEITACLTIAIAALALVLAIEWWAAKLSS